MNRKNILNLLCAKTFACICAVALTGIMEMETVFGSAAAPAFAERFSGLIRYSEEAPNAEGESRLTFPEVGKYGMTPIAGTEVADGSYPVEVDSSSPFFKVKSAILDVENGEMTGHIEIGSHSYLHVFLGNPKDAEKAEDAEWIEPEEDGDSYWFTFPVEALNKPIDCAAYSRRREKWYDRRILFDASSLPEEALRVELPDYDLIEEGLKSLQASGDKKGVSGSDGTAGDATTGSPHGGSKGDAYFSQEAVEVPYEDGEYSIEVSMTGGTGRASISSPTLMVVKEGRAYAKVLWSSAHYDWMAVAGNTYYNENAEGGNSYFMIPITDMDTIMEVVANTTAMGDPVAIHYSLTFYADTIGNKGQIPQEAAKKVLIAAAVIIAVGAAANTVIKKRRKR